MSLIIRSNVNNLYFFINLRRFRHIYILFKTISMKYITFDFYQYVLDVIDYILILKIREKYRYIKNIDISFRKK